MLAVALLAGLALVGGLAAQEGETLNGLLGQSSPAPDEPARIVWPSDLIVPSERSFKADQIERLGYAPDVVFFGGSRSTRFEPSYLAKKTGLRGFNLAMSNAKSEDAWVFAHLLHERSPQTTPLWIWGIQPWTLTDNELEAGLVQDPRLNQYLPAHLLLEEGKALPRDPADVPTTGRADKRRYADDGVVLWDTYDGQYAHGLTLERSLKKYLEHALRKVNRNSAAATMPVKRTRARLYFEETLGYLNSIGVTPLLVGMPVHPTVLDGLLKAGGRSTYPRFLGYIDSLRGRYDFEFIDLREIQSFDGDPAQFYDGVHVRFANARRIIDKLIRTYPALFEKGGGGGSPEAEVTPGG